ncbi:MAG: threonine synthase [candidate division WOR-3 bacterium]|nr:MAG: threonine synthase [candidate division WOR-3 bacterium]
MAFVKYLQCAGCGARVEDDRLWNVCTVCGKPLVAIYDLKKVRKKITRDAIKSRPPDLWRYHELLPVEDPDGIRSLGEGYTPLVHAARLGERLGFPTLYIKDESQNPTGSFKARGMAVAVARARELDVREIVLPSAGNAASALSAFSALHGLNAYVYLPHDIAKTYVIECISMGAHVELVPGLITDCGERAAQDAAQHDRFNMATLREPYRIEGKKTMGLELAEQMGWTLPDVIIYPTGGGTGLIGMWKSFEELQNMGWITSRLPRMVSVQSQGCAPIVRAFTAGAETAQPWAEAATIADGLRVPAALGDFMILRALRESRGTAVAVSDEEMLNAIKEIGSTEGIFCCPEGAATLAAFKRLREQGWIKDGERVVLFNTATGLKYIHLWAQDLRL